MSIDRKCQCGLVAPPDARFCPSCGAQIENAGTSQAHLEEGEGRTPGKWRSAVLVAVAIGVVVAFLGLFLTHKLPGFEDPIQAKLKAHNASLAKVQRMALRWQDAVKLTSSTPRIALAGPVQSLQKIATDARALRGLTSCMHDALIHLIRAIDASVDANLAFMQQEESTQKRQFELMNSHADDYLIARENCTAKAGR
jgi:hypothetical protein